MGNDVSKNLDLEQQRKMYESNLKVTLSSQKNKNPSSEWSSETMKFQNSLVAAQKEIDEKNSKIEELQREIDKLKSVLDQTYCSDPEMELEKSSQPRTKRLGISGESSNQQKMHVLHRFPKSNEVKRFIRLAIMNNHLLNKLDPGQVNEIIECMYEKHAVENCFVIREGDEGEHLFVAEEGEFEIYKDEELIGKMSNKKCFGELALLYNCKRTASVKALNTATLWVLDRNMFQTIMMKTGLERQKDLIRFLKSVNIFENLPERKMLKIVELIEVQSYSEDQCIIRQGEEANSFFIVQSGWVKVTQKVEDEEIEVREMTVGDYFGEIALLDGGKRTASIYAMKGPTEVLCLYSQVFAQLIGDLNEFQIKEYDDDSRIKSSIKGMRLSEESCKEVNEPIHLSDLEIIATLGLGGFGRVELVINKKDPTKSYALKCMKKQYIVEMKQQEHVLSEKKILAECRSPFICRLHATFRDNKYVYLLTEVCLGGELWTILRDKVHFDDNITRFSVGCVLEAFNYIHSRGIVYRDLKPENLLIGNTGYLKLCDFGFSKKIGFDGRTWTFCGTPEYVAPEIILNKGHDFAADFWSIGILAFELLNGSPPFISNDPMKIYHMILKGIETSNLFHNIKISPKAASFIQRMCRFLPIERLGNGKAGLSEIRMHKYFQGFDWDGLKMMILKSPFNQKILGPRDLNNFDKFNIESSVPKDELSGWEKDF